MILWQARVDIVAPLEKGAWSYPIDLASAELMEYMLGLWARKNQHPLLHTKKGKKKKSNMWSLQTVLGFAATVWLKILCAVGFGRIQHSAIGTYHWAVASRDWAKIWDPDLYWYQFSIQTQISWRRSPLCWVCTEEGRKYIIVLIVLLKLKTKWREGVQTQRKH